jgi:tRNA threonylcarbamoyladenosine biosynthesis protein TsaB
MLILALDTSSHAGSVALLRDMAVVAQLQRFPDEDYAVSLLRETRNLLGGVSISLEQIDLFAANAGPGSFTGLRVGLTTAKGWAEVWGRPVARVSGLEAMATQISRPLAPDSLIAAVTDARRGQIFGALFRRRAEGFGELERVGDEVVNTADEFIESLRPQLGSTGGVPVACLLPGLIQPAMERQGLSCSRVEVVSSVLAPFIGQLGYAKAARADVVDALQLDANYIRRSDAEMNWKTG